MNKSETYDAIIIGAGLTGLTCGYYLAKAGLSVKIIEKNNRAGGVINTESENGFTYENGPNSGVLATPDAAELFEELNDKCELETAKPESKKRLILKNGKWCELPSGLVSAITTPLFTFYDKINILAEPFREKGNDPEESVAGLVRRRLGGSFLDYAVDPFIAGIYAGNPENLITKYALPKLYKLEQQYGSFIKGAIKKKKEFKSEREKKANKEVFSAKGGLVNLVNALISSFDGELDLNCTKTKIYTKSKPYKITYTKNDVAFEIYSDNVITTTGGYALEGMLGSEIELLNHVINLKYAKVVQAVIGFKKWNGMSLNAFGGLIPSREKRKTLGILFMSSIFSNRCPDGGALISVFMAGERNPEIYSLPEGQIRELALSEVSDLLNENGQPDLLKIFKYKSAIPQYDSSSEKRLSSIDAIQNKYPGLVLAGNIRDGIGMADRIAQARNIAEIITNDK
ncbi:MAG: protoporphyrinogen oxidase [Candidatus Kapaibacterium sp.]